MNRQRVQVLVLWLALTLAACDRESEVPAIEDTATETTLAETSSGELIYVENCASCHEGGIYKAPHRSFLGMMAPDAILASLDGTMASQAANLSKRDKLAVAEYLAGRSVASQVATHTAPICEQADLDMSQPPSQLGWGIDYKNHRFQPATGGGLTLEQAKQLELKWAFAYPSSIQARSQPTVAGGTVFVGSQNGTIYALDAETACVRWTFRASAEVRTPISISDWTAGDDQAQPRAYFGDILARAYALDARTGELIWMQKVDDHPNATITGAPLLVENRLFVPVSSLEVVLAANPNYACCTFRGSLVALEAGSGTVAWKSYTIDEEPSEVARTSAGTAIFAPSGAPIWNSPTADLKRRQLYSGTGENFTSPANDRSDAIIAFDMDSGDIKWIAQATQGDAWNVGCLSDYAPDPANCPEENGPDFDFAAPPILFEFDDGRELLVAGQKSGDAMAIDPDTGKFVWRKTVGRGGVQGGTHFGMAAESSRVYVPINDMIYPEDVTRYKFTQDPRPGLFALDAITGDEIWANEAENTCPEDNIYCDPGISAAITAIPGAIVAGHLDGKLRLYSATDGAVVWEFDTLRGFETVSGEIAQGGSMSGGGPTVGNEMLYVNSGYGIYMHMPGNVLLAFGLPNP